MMQIAEAAKISRHLLTTLQQVIIGKEQVLQHLLLGLYSGGNVLLEDFPGVAKTLIARLMAQVTGLEFKRLQFTPDLLPGDITGGFIYNQKMGEFEFRPGPLFTNLVLADEVNRAPPKTQAALLEVMQERQVTIEGTTYPMRRPFVVLATQNPIELEGTYPLPEAQLDRFIMRLRVGYPNLEEERLILAQRGARRQEKIDLTPVIDATQLLHLQATVEQVHTSAAVEQYIVSLTAATRQHNQVQVGVSPRGSLALYQLARAHAMLHERDFVLPDDVKAMAITALAHRLLLKPEFWVRGIQAEDIIQDILTRTPIPKAEEPAVGDGHHGP
jgi:MoxR-like ATPase